MRKHCEEGRKLCRRFERVLKIWGFANADTQAMRLLPVGPTKANEFTEEIGAAEKELGMARHAYVEHVAHCLVCSRRLIAPRAKR